MKKFYASLQILSRQLAVVELREPNCEWAGSFRVDARTQDDLYELGYARASQEAALKGGRVEQYQMIPSEARDRPRTSEGLMVLSWVLVRRERCNT